jgi:hypothetical protein
MRRLRGYQIHGPPSGAHIIERDQAQITEAFFPETGCGVVQLTAFAIARPGAEVQAPAKTPQRARFYRPSQKHPQRFHAHAGKQRVKIACPEKVMLLIRKVFKGFS